MIPEKNYGPPLNDPQSCTLTMPPHLAHLAPASRTITPPPHLPPPTSRNIAPPPRNIVPAPPPPEPTLVIPPPHLNLTAPPDPMIKIPGLWAPGLRELVLRDKRQTPRNLRFDIQFKTATRSKTLLRVKCHRMS